MVTVKNICGLAGGATRWWLWWVWCGSGVGLVWIWCVPGFGQDDLLARPGRGSRLALLHRHQVADIGEHRFEVRHLQPPSGRHRIDTKYHTGNICTR